MQVSVETTSGLERRMTIDVPKDTIDTEIQSRLKSLAGTAKMSGFRPGKVPFNVIKKRYGKQVENEVRGEVIQKSFYDAIMQEKLKPAGSPHIESSKDDDNDAASSLSFIATFEVYPEIELTTMDNITIEKPVVDISDEDIDGMIETIRKQRIEWKTADRPSQKDDRVKIDFEGKIDHETFDGGSGKGMEVELGSGRMIAGFEEQLEGVNVDEEKTLSMTFPEDYHNKDVAGKPVTFEAKVISIEQPVLPELDDEFVKSMGVTEGGMEKFREQVKTNMAREAEQSIKNKLKQQVLDELLEKTEFDVPKVLIDSEIQQLAQQQQQQLGEQAAKELDPSLFEEQARRRVALGLVLSEIVSQKEIKVEPAKVRNIVEGIAASYEHPEEVVKYYYGDKQRMAEVENFALEAEVVEWVISQASVAEKSTAFNDLVN